MADPLQDRFFDQLQPGQMMESLFEAIPGAYYFVKDHDLRFVTGSQDFAESLGAESIGQVIGKTDHDFSPKFLADAFRADDQSVIKTGKPLLNKVELVPAADGSLDWLCTTKIPLWGREGVVIGLAGVARVIRDSDALYADLPEMHGIVEFVKAQYRENITVADMAKAGGVSQSTQEKLFRETFGLTPLMYLRRTRLNAACRLLHSSDMEISKVALECGFNDQTNMTRAFRLELKITPLKYRKQFTQAVRRRRGRPGRILHPVTPRKQQV